MPESSPSPQPDQPASAAALTGGQISTWPLAGLTEPASIELLEIASPSSDDSLLTELLKWTGEETAPPPVVLDLYGTLVVWTPTRVAVAASPDRLPLATAAVLDFAATAAELTQIEANIAAAWPDYETDLPCGFMLHEHDPHRARELAERYRRAMSLAGRLTRISPCIHQPLKHPPTLASQIGERLRDRCRLADREEFASDQLELITGLYESCGQRVSEHAIARREYVLIWVIVLLLAVEMVLLLVDLLASAGA